MDSKSNIIQNDNKSTNAQVIKLEMLLEQEKLNVETLEAKQRQLIAQLEIIAQRESDVREEMTKYEKELTILKHSYKEIQRKAEYESDLRKNTEQYLSDLKKRFDEEQNKRTRELNNNQQHNDKIHILEKQVNEMQEKLKIETENCQRLRKQANELTMAKSNSEIKVSEYQTMLQSLQSQRDSLQEEVSSLQEQLTQERNSRSQASDQQMILEKKLQTLNVELEILREKELKTSVDNNQLTEKVSFLEKECAGLDLELKAVKNRYQQEVKAHEETERSRMLNKEEANLEVVKGMVVFLKFLMKYLF